MTSAPPFPAHGEITAWSDRRRAQNRLEVEQLRAENAALKEEQIQRALKKTKSSIVNRKS